MFAHKILNHWEMNIKQELYYGSCILWPKSLAQFPFTLPLSNTEICLTLLMLQCYDSSLKIKNFTAIF